MLSKLYILSFHPLSSILQLIWLLTEFREFSSSEAVLDALGKKEIDVIPAISVQDRYEAVMDFSQSYLKSGLSIAVPAEGVHYRWFKVIENVFPPHLLKAIGLLFFMSLIIGIVVWLFERQDPRF